MNADPPKLQTKQGPEGHARSETLPERKPLPLRRCEQRLLDDRRVGVPCALPQLSERRGRLGLQHRLDTLRAREATT